MSESDTNSNSYLEEVPSSQPEHNPDDQEEDIDIDAGNEDLLGDDNDAMVSNLAQQEPFEGQEAGDEEDEDEHADGDVIDDLFGSDPDDDDAADHDENNDTNTAHPRQQQKELDRQYQRTVPEGKKLSIATHVNLSELPSSADYDFCILRLPNVIGCETEAFDEETYVAPSHSQSIDNYIRWRLYHESANDETYKESNTRLVHWKDGTKSLIIGKDCYDIDEQTLHGDRDYIYARLPIDSASNGFTDSYNSNGNKKNKMQSFQLCHSRVIKKLNVRTTTQKSYQTLQKNLAKKHERTKGSKQLTALQRITNRTNYEREQQSRQKRNVRNNLNYKKKVNRKRKMDEAFLTQNAHGVDSEDDDDDEDEDYLGHTQRKKIRRAEANLSNDSASGEEDDADDSDDSDDDDVPIGRKALS
eukprot:CAMPEP_0197024154 /NCGR_PEP_ID=MMETSP1384-20130603/4783_1 /TAXON_ID=29189 /ORGANISM="Ammonia sp." /LENGTH=414 /DNA_ID=CAMNT_0042452499 /DNA_START=22 /DNA_END=1266 /DNA_ORIENTATION=+